VLTKQLQQAVRREMNEPVEVAMRYGQPSARQALETLHIQNPNLEEVVLFPLYPHYAMSSYETAVEDVVSVHKTLKYSSKLNIIKPFFDNEHYIDALAESIRPYLQTEYDKIIFSYHGIPERHIYKSDVTGCHCLKIDDCCHVPSAAHEKCYRHQTIVTTELVIKALNIPAEKVEQTFQSRLGRDPWLTPYTAVRLSQLPAEGTKKILVVCPAFISDCLETLEEIALGGREIFLQAGGEFFATIPCLNVHPAWVKAVAKLIPLTPVRSGTGGPEAE
jgi:ferrochelatase